MELFEVLRSRMVWTMVAAVAVVTGVTALVWPAVGIALLVGVFALGAVAACGYAVYELLVAAGGGTTRARHEEPAVRITRVEEPEVAELPVERR